MTDEVRGLHDEVLAGGGPQYVERHRARGKMMVRERLEALVDPGTPVLELCPLAGLQTGDPVGGGVVVALAEVARTQCLVIANDPTVRGGTTSPTTIRKLLRAMDVAEENRLPVLLMVESGGADLPRQADVFVPGGEQFRRLTQLSAQGIPTICVVFGSSTAGGAYLPGMSDYTVMVEGRARVFLGGPPLVKMAIGEEADEEELGGARMHAQISGLCDYLARDEPEAIRMARGIVAHLHWRRLGPGADGPADEPLYPAEELLGVASVDVRVPFDVREILARVVDGSRFEEFKEAYGPQLVCGWASLGGYPIGVVANNGILFSPEAQKGAQFIALCNRTDTPILFVQNITGFMVGHALRAGRHHQGRCQADQRRLELDGAAPHPHGRRQLRGGELRHGGPGLRPALRLHVAQPPHRGHGPQAAGRSPLHRAPQCRRGGGPPLRRGGRRGAAPGHGEPDRGGVDGAVRHRAAVGRRDHRPAGHAHGARHRADRCALGRRCEGPRSSAWCGTDGAAPSAASSWPTGARSPAALVRGAHDAGCEAVAVYAADDADSPHVGEADAAVLLPGASLAETYLSRPRWCGRPGWRARTPCTPATGSCPRTPPSPRRAPRPASSGSGRRPRRCGSWATRRGPRRWWRRPVCPCCRAPWWRRGADEAALAAAAAVGYPLLVKASAGGGGRGMRLVREPGRAGRCRRVGATGGRRRLRLRRGLPGALPARLPATSRSR